MTKEQIEEIKKLAAQLLSIQLKLEIIFKGEQSYMEVVRNHMSDILSRSGIQCIALREAYTLFDPILESLDRVIHQSLTEQKEVKK